MSICKYLVWVVLGVSTLVSLENNAQAAVITFYPIDTFSHQPFTNGGYGAVIFYAVDADENTLYPDENNSYVVTKLGKYRISGASARNICYPGSVEVEIVDINDSISVYLPVSCE